MTEKQVKMIVRIPQSTRKLLKVLSAQNEKSMNDLCLEAIVKYLETLAEEARNGNTSSNRAV